MRLALLLLAVILVTPGKTARYELRGRLVPGTAASVWLHGATAPFEASTLADSGGRFRFRDLPPGAYTLGAIVPGRGEIRRTIEIGPSQADARGRINLTLELDETKLESGDSLRQRAMVSVTQLAIPEQALREYAEGQKNLGRRDVPAAVARFQRAVELAPQFAAAWNHLGTIAYQTRDLDRAESCFRKALDAEPGFYQAVVNLGGVLINLSKFDQALDYNLSAVHSRPNDALANSQLGMNYYFLDRLDLGRKYLTIAKHLDPAHFSHPQLVLAQIDLRRHDRAAAAGELEEFLQYHPDSPEAGKIKGDIARLRAQAGPAQAFAATGMARSFSAQPDLPPLDGGVLKDGGRFFLQTRDAAGSIRKDSIDATIGSGRHVRMLLSRSAGGGWTEMPLAWYPEAGGRYGPSPGFGFSAECLACHAAQEADHPSAIGCQSCHGAADDVKPGPGACLKCHVETSGPGSAHGAASSAGEDRFELNSAGYRLLLSRCYRNTAGQLTCATCHPAHGFSKTLAEYRMVCRGCHPQTHNAAALDCTRCHMPKRPAQDAGHTLVTDHRIQRPL